MHELIHTLGFTHMQNHINRDSFVKIHWNRIQSERRHNFDNVDVSEYGNFNTPYDFASLMHYENDAFAKNSGEITIEPLDGRYRPLMGYHQELSNGDI